MKGMVLRYFLSAGAIAAVALAVSTTGAARQAPPVLPVNQEALREYAGVYRWGANAFVYLQVWHEFSGFSNPGLLTAFDESGEVRTLYPTEHDRFYAGAGIAVPASIESHVQFQRDGAGRISSLTWQRSGERPRTAPRVDVEKQEEVRFSNGGVRLAGTLRYPSVGVKHPAIILVHGSGAADRDYVLPFARFLIRHGIAVLGYDKRGVGGSTGDWNTASFEDLAGDVIAAYEYLKTRRDIDATQIGMLGVSQAGWVMPLAAVRAQELAFLISISGAGVSPAETTIDQSQNELAARGMKPETVSEIIALMKLQYAFAQTGQGWDAYSAARDKLAARIGQPPDTFPATRDHPHWQVIRRMYFHDPAPILRRLRLPVLALFGELDTNIVAEKNRSAWERALKEGGHVDHTLLIVPRANHLHLEAKTGNNAEMATLQRFAPTHATRIREWLATRVKGFGSGAVR